ncbi:hypothetical protein BU16DRAFT_568231 [Lophium mytilinum]|uniref:Ankyrin n=1 Tax=Lophium mytilinum TaxID=390894 RepID=A0A6A6QB61_9PEZI|nr:hypothetical protein BU16DRAFT_568231 [Lophium mytilinum]
MLSLALQPRWGCQIDHHSSSWFEFEDGFSDVSGKDLYRQIWALVLRINMESDIEWPWYDLAEPKDAFDLVKHTVALTRYLLGEVLPTEELFLKYYLQEACCSGTTKLVKLLLARGAKPCCFDLNSAIRSGHLGITKLLLDHGVRIARPLVAYHGYQSASGIDGRESYRKEIINPSPIIRVVLLEHTAMLCLLRSYGVRIDHPEVGGLALKKAAEQGLESMVELLLKDGVPLHGQSCGLSPRDCWEAGEVKFRHDSVGSVFAKVAGVPVDELPNLEICPHCEPLV